MNGIKVTDETPVGLLTLGQLKAALSEVEERRNDRTDLERSVERRYVYGLNGIRQLFNCSTPTAFRLKRTVIKDAVCQQGRVIITDVEKAMELFKAHKENS